MGRPKLRYGPFSQPAYARFWLAGLLSFTGLWVQTVSRSWMVQELTGSPLLVALIPVATMLPMLFLSLPSGVMADNLDRRRIVLITEATNVLSYIALTVLVAFGAVQVWHILALSVLNGTANAVAGPARLALVPTLVRKDVVRSAVSLSASVFNLAQIIGPAIGGVLIARHGTDSALLAGLFFSVPAWFLYASVRTVRAVESPRRASPLANLKTGFVYTFSNPTLRLLMLGGLAVTITLNAWSAMLPTFADSALHRGAEAFGTLTLALGAGALLGSLFIAFVGDRIAHEKIELGAVLAFGAAVFAFAVSPWLSTAIAAAALAGFAATSYFVTNMTVAQMTASEEYRGRVMSIRFLVIGTTPLGTLTLGAVAQVVGVREALLGLALLGVVAFSVVRLVTRPRTANQTASEARPVTAPALPETTP